MNSEHIPIIRQIGPFPVSFCAITVFAMDLKLPALQIRFWAKKEISHLLYVLLEKPITIWGAGQINLCLKSPPFKIDNWLVNRVSCLLHSAEPICVFWFHIISNLNALEYLLFKRRRIHFFKLLRNNLAMAPSHYAKLELNVEWNFKMPYG